MNHAGIGKIISNSSIHIPSDLLSPLSIVEGVKVWGMYYPNIHTDKESHKIKHDLMLCPIPFEFWGKSARLVVRTKHENDVFLKLTHELKKQDVSILVSEASRSAFRYDTWNLIICFDGIAHDEYDEGEKAFSKTLLRIRNLRDHLDQTCSEIFWTDPRDVILKDPFFLMPYQAMSHFYNLALNGPEESLESCYSWAFYKPFSLMCTGENRLEATRDSEFRSIIDCLVDGIEEFHPCFLFAESNSLDRNIRAALIPTRSRNRAFGVTVKFTRSQPPGTSKGVVNAVLKSFPGSYDCWGITNRTELFLPAREIGRADFIVLDDLSVPIHERQELLRSKFSKFLVDDLPTINKWSIDCYLLDTLVNEDVEFNISPGEVLPMYDVFISYSTQNEGEANKIAATLQGARFRYFMSGKSIEGGSKWGDEIRRALLASREIIMLYSSQAAKSSWVKHEYGAAWALGKMITPVVLNMEMGDLPRGLDEYQAYYFQDIGEEWNYLSQLKDRIQKSLNRVLQRS